MTIRNLFNALKEVCDHQYSDEILLMWLNELEEQLVEYLESGYDTYETRWSLGNIEQESPLIDQPSLYIEFLAHKICVANGEFERANNHAALYNTYLLDWRERYFRTHTGTTRTSSDHIRGL